MFKTFEEELNDLYNASLNKSREKDPNLDETSHKKRASIAAITILREGASQGNNGLVPTGALLACSALMKRIQDETMDIRPLTK